MRSIACAGFVISITATLSAQEPAGPARLIPYAPGVMLTYVMHNIGEPDREFVVTVETVSPEESVVSQVMEYHAPDGTLRRTRWHRTVSRRELARARTINHGTSCYPADTLDTSRRGSVLRMASQQMLRQLLELGQSELRIYYNFSCDPARVASGTVQRLSAEPVAMTVLVDELVVTLPTIRAGGTLTARGGPMQTEYWFLSDPDRPWMIRNDMRWMGQTYYMQLVRVTTPRAASVESTLERTCRTPLPGVFFATASDRLAPESGPALDQVAAMLREHPDWTLVIEGHTDSIGGAKSNLDLSTRRAVSVRAALITTYGIADPRLTTRGYGLTRPVAPNHTIEGRAQNRRVEVVRPCATPVAGPGGAP